MFTSGFRPSLENVSCFRAFMILYDVISLRTFKVNRSQFFGHPKKTYFLENSHIWAALPILLRCLFVISCQVKKIKHLFDEIHVHFFL